MLAAVDIISKAAACIQQGRKQSVKAMAMQLRTRRVDIGSGPAWTAPASVSSELNQRASMLISLPGYIML